MVLLEWQSIYPSILEANEMKFNYRIVISNGRAAILVMVFNCFRMMDLNSLD